MVGLRPYLYTSNESIGKERRMVCLAGQLFKFSLHARATPLSLLLSPFALRIRRVFQTHTYTHFHSALRYVYATYSAYCVYAAYSTLFDAKCVRVLHNYRCAVLLRSWMMRLELAVPGAQFPGHNCRLNDSRCDSNNSNNSKISCSGKHNIHHARSI